MRFLLCHSFVGLSGCQASLPVLDTHLDDQVPVHRSPLVHGHDLEGEAR
jgi:hypothetical protein